MKVLMCRPDYFDIEYEINPWMRVENKVNYARALAQLFDALSGTVISQLL